MAYDFIGLVNDVCGRLNEVKLTTTNFATTTGYYTFVKEAVNSSIRHITQEEFEWSWNHVENELILVAGVSREPYPSDAKKVNMQSFRIKRDATIGNGTEYLKEITYEEYLEKYVDQEYDSGTSNRGIPRMIVQAPSREFILVPEPDEAYTLVYEYYTLGYDLEGHDDVPSIPEPYRHVIINGAMYYAYQFRNDAQMANMSQVLFEDGIKHLRTLHINRYKEIRDRRVSF